MTLPALARGAARRWWLVVIPAILALALGLWTAGRRPPPTTVYVVTQRFLAGLPPERPDADYDFARHAPQPLLRGLVALLRFRVGCRLLACVPGSLRLRLFLFSLALLLRCLFLLCLFLLCLFLLCLFLLCLFLL